MSCERVQLQPHAAMCSILTQRMSEQLSSSSFIAKKMGSIMLAHYLVGFLYLNWKPAVSSCINPKLTATTVCGEQHLATGVGLCTMRWWRMRTAQWRSTIRVCCPMATRTMIVVATILHQLCLLWFIPGTVWSIQHVLHHANRYLVYSTQVLNNRNLIQFRVFSATFRDTFRDTFRNVFYRFDRIFRLKNRIAAIKSMSLSS